MASQVTPRSLGPAGQVRKGIRKGIGSAVVVRPRTPQGRARETNRRLTEEFPQAHCELDHDGPFQLLAATILSAQCTDVRVNMVTPHLFARYPTPEALADASLTDVEEIVRSTGFYSSKARNLVGMAQRLVEAYDGEVPGAMEDLVTLPGVGRKTANVVRSVVLGLPGLPVDTHVLRLSRRLGITAETDPVKVEYVLNAMIPAAERGRVQLADDLARPPHLLRPQAQLRRVRLGRLLPLGRFGRAVGGSRGISARCSQQRLEPTYR